MPKERDPRVQAVAEKLAMAQPYGFEYVKSGPSAADYHAAIIAVKTLDEMDEREFEYAAQETSLITGETTVFGTWVTCELAKERVKRWTDYEKENVKQGLDHEFTYKLVCRRKVGKVQDV